MRIRIIALLGLFLPQMLTAQVDPLAENKLRSFFKYVELAYVDSVDASTLVESAIYGILEDLDPHSSYIPLEDLQRMNEPLQGNFEGIGIQFNILHDTIVVVSPISGGPSEKLGIQSGDKIIAINGDKVAGVGYTNQDVMDNLRGEKGSKVTVGIKRKRVKNLIEFNITRDKIPIYSVDAAYMATSKIGYIKLNRFARTSMDEIHEALDSLNKEGMKSMILDLRGNSGGYLDIAIDLADEFLSKNKLIVYTEGRSYPREEFSSTSSGSFEKGKLVVLVDEGSASASEIVSGAIQDWDRGLVIGRRSFGKGLVQKPFSLPDGSAIRLTTSRYYTPSGRSIQKPYEEGLEAYYNDLNERFKHGEFTHPDSIRFPDSLKYKTRINERTVYGGGGIMPDIFIPLDTTGSSDFYGKLVRGGFLSNFSLVYLDQHREALIASHNGISSFVESFSSKDVLEIPFKTYLESEDLEWDEAGYTKSEKLIYNTLKALIARGLYPRGAFYQVTNATNEGFNKAVDAIEGKAFDSFNISYR